MSQTYTDLDLTGFPEEIDALSGFTDPTREQLIKILSYESLLRQGNYDAAAALLAENPEIGDFQITASKLNRHEQMIIAIERMFSEDIAAYLEAARNSVTGTIQADVAEAKTNAANALTAANEASAKVSGTVRVSAQGTLTLQASGWTQEGELFVQTVNLSGMTTTGRMRYSLADNAIGSVFIAGVTCPQNGKVKVLCFSRPTAAFGLRYAIEEVNS